MLKLICLSMMVCIAGCSPLPDSTARSMSMPNGQMIPSAIVGPMPRQKAESRYALYSVAGNNKFPHRAPNSTRIKSGHRGIAFHKHISEYSDTDLLGAIPGELAVIVKDRRNLELTRKKLEKLGFTVKQGLIDHLVISIPEKTPYGLRKHFDVIDRHEDVLMVAPRFHMKTFYSANDPKYKSGEQPGLALINASEAWDFADVRNSNHRIAIVDTGMEGSHPDLSRKFHLSINARPTVDWTAQYSSNVYDFVGHGTGVAGIAAASTDNGIGIASAGWGSKIMAVAVNEPKDSPKIPADNARAGIIWAVDNGAKVINCSFGNPDPDGMLFNAFQYAWERGVPIICATGNNGVDEISAPSSFAEYFPNVIAVGATDNTGNARLPMSQYGSWIGLVAPGEDNISTEPNGGYTDLAVTNTNGTSFAAPYVSGAFCSLSYACNALPYWEIRDAFFRTATDIGSPGWDNEHGYGRLNFGAAAKFLLSEGRVFKWVVGNTEEKYWTTSANINVAAGMIYDEVGFRLSPVSRPGLERLYVRVNSATRDRLLSTISTEGGSAYTTESVLGYLSDTRVGSFQYFLYRLKSPQGFHHFTIDYDEASGLINNKGWIYEGSVGFVASNYATEPILVGGSKSDYVGPRPSTQPSNTPMPTPTPPATPPPTPVPMPTPTPTPQPTPRLSRYYSQTSWVKGSAMTAMITGAASTIRHVPLTATDKASQGVAGEAMWAKGRTGNWIEAGYTDGPPASQTINGRCFYWANANADIGRYQDYRIMDNVDSAGDRRSYIIQQRRLPIYLGGVNAYHVFISEKNAEMDQVLLAGWAGLFYEQIVATDHGLEVTARNRGTILNGERARTSPPIDFAPPRPPEMRPWFSA